MIKVKSRFWSKALPRPKIKLSYHNFILHNFQKNTNINNLKIFISNSLKSRHPRNFHFIPFIIDLVPSDPGSFLCIAENARGISYEDQDRRCGIK